MAKRQKLTKNQCLEVVHRLCEIFPDAKAELDFSNPFELLVATVLSAQCTDVRVNEVTKTLFKVAPTASALANIDLEALEILIKPCGLYKSKAKNLKLTAERLVSEFDSEVPSSIEVLMTLPGVGKKTANVVVSNAFDIPAIAVDTHVFRVSNRIGLVCADTVEKTEEQLMAVVPKELWTKTHHTIIFQGRRVCKARKPECDACELTDLCLYFKHKNDDTAVKRTAAKP